MAKEKKFVESITDMEVDFPQWYTDVVKKADLTAYSSLYSATSDFSSVYMSVTAFDLYHYSDQWSFS